MRSIPLVLVSILMVLALLVACAPAAPTAAPVATAPPAATAKPVAPAPTVAAPAAQPTATTAAKPVTTPSAAPVATAAPKAKRGGIIKNAFYKEINSWDPIFNDNGNLQSLPVFQNLLRWNQTDEATGKHELAGELAESWKFDDTTHLTLNLRKGVKFHDGSDFNGDVVKWNLERARDDPKSLGKRLVEDITAVNVVDPYTVKITYKAPSALALASLTRATGGSGSAGSLMASKAAFEKQGAEGVASKPSGTGPFKMTEWLRDDKLSLGKFDGYWGKGVDGQPLPYVDGLLQRQIADKTVILVELRSGAMDVTTEALPQAFETIKADPNLKLWLLPAVTSQYMIGLNQDRPPFGGNIKLMQAAQHAIDREAIAKTVGFGVAKPLYYGSWIAGWPGYDESLPKYEYNLNKAKQLMSEASVPGGVDAELSYQTTSPPLDKVSEMVERMWQAIGIRPKIAGLEALAFRSKQNAGDFDSALWRMAYSLDIAYFDRQYLSDGASNYARFHDVEVDKCMKEGASLLDFNARHEVYKRCIKAVYEAASLQGVYSSPYNFVYRKEVKGLRAQYDQLDFTEVWLDK